MGLMSALGQLTVVVFLTFFALASGNLFRNKLLRIAGTSLERRKITIHVLEDITNQIQRYLLVQVFTSVLVGVATGLAYWALGLENAAVWGVVAGVLNLAPYIGSALVTGASALVAFPAVRLVRHGPGHWWCIARDPHHRRQPAHTLAHQPHQQHEPRRRVRERAGLGLALGPVGAATGHSRHDGREGGVRPGGRLEGSG